MEQPGVLACLSRRTTTLGVVPGVQIPSRALAMIAARYANRQSGATTLRVVPETFVTAGSTPACATQKNMRRLGIGEPNCLRPPQGGGARASPKGYAGSTPARRTEYGPFVYRHRIPASHAGATTLRVVPGSIPARAT